MKKKYVLKYDFMLEIKFGRVTVKQLWLRYSITVAGVKRDAAVLEQHGQLSCLQ
jgi:hypothetical protein